VTRWLALAFVGIVALAGTAMVVIHRVTEPAPSDASASRRQQVEPLAASLPAPSLPTAPEPLPAPGPLPVPAAQLELGPQPPTLSANLQVRSDQLLELRSQRRLSAMDQQNAREAARRARLGITP
jgi:hypothetical protein